MTLVQLDSEAPAPVLLLELAAHVPVDDLAHELSGGVLCGKEFVQVLEVVLLEHLR